MNGKNVRGEGSSTGLGQLLAGTAGLVCLFGLWSAVARDSDADARPDPKQPTGALSSGPPSGSNPTIRQSFWWAEGDGRPFKELAIYADANGATGIIHAGGEIETKGHPFFSPIGTNGRACVTCHQPSNAMSISAETIQRRWDATQGADPLFAAIDGSNCPSLPQAEKESHSLLIEHGLFRLGFAWPPRDSNGAIIEPEFEIEVFSDPAGCNVDPDYGLNSDKPTISVYRRPRPVANLPYATTTRRRFNNKIGLPQPIDPDTGEPVNLPITADARHPTLKMQAADAFETHLQGAVPMNQETLQELVDFESAVYMAREEEREAGMLVEPGGPKALGVEAMKNGKVMVFANNWRNPVFHDFEAWRSPENAELSKQAAFRASVVRGYDIFMTRPIWISDVAHFNSIGMGNPYKRNCAICHNVQMVGTDISPGVLDIGVNTLPIGPDMPGLPIFKLTCNAEAEPHPYLGREVLTHDPGRALISGRCQDIAALAMQQLRGLSARAPYFSNGSAANLIAVVEYYDERFGMEMNEQEKQDLVNFLSVL